MSAPSIAQQIDDFNTGFEAQIGDRLAGVFGGEQADLRGAGVPDGALGVGASAPDAALLAVDGSETSFSDARDGKAAVVVFYRGAWCPYCNITLRAYQEKLVPALHERGATLIAVSPQTPDGSSQSVTNGSLDFTVLSDPGNRLADQFGIVTEPSAAARAAHTELGFDVADSNADESARIPFPSVYVIDEAGVVRFADVHVDYTTRTEPEEIIAALERIRGE
ncbi:MULTISPECIES: peroxiredoxin-like family protein [Microbacterium]|uniref:peroxiredoxin-like family protein n=1 Tax=Microbacterium TaxID=33882 RepID=UPI00277F2C1E|nr:MULTISPECIES: peroxiredoxin-like family protein [Microbacterium]MDQ1084587.1 peroxiredoxin [Microbacterium sp. SORGH_AS_0344]MDQ1170135.1 peroxiredoxin [Microbacterium proteolyticum]